jgi:hypothetical protein
MFFVGAADIMDSLDASLLAYTEILSAPRKKSAVIEAETPQNAADDIGR